MRNNTTNKKVIKAISIGLSAMMALQPVMATPVFADELPADPASTEAQENLQAVKNTTKTAESDTNAIANPINVAVQSGRDENAYKSTDKIGQELNQATAKVEETKPVSVTNSDKTIIKDERKKVSDAAIKLVDDAKRDYGAKYGVDAEELMNEVKNVINSEDTLNKAKAVDEAVNAESKALGDLNDSLATISNEIEGYTGLINIATGEINSASSIPAAGAALAEAATQRQNAEDAFNEAQKQYDEVANAYADKVKEVTDAEAAYVAALNGTKENLAKAEGELATAKTDLENLKKAEEDAQTKLATTTIGKLAAALDATKNKGSNWGQLDLIMKDVLKYYYFPSQGISASKVKIDSGFTKKTPDLQGVESDDANYIMVTITNDDGSIETKYFNYCCKDAKGNNDGKNSSMIIFEKNPEVVTPEHYEADTDKDGKIESFDKSAVENAANQIELSFLNEKKDADVTGKYVKITNNNENTFYRVNEAGDTKTVTAEEWAASDADGKSGSYIKSVADKTTWSTNSVINEAGDKIIETSTGEVTRTTFVKNASLSDIAKTESTATTYDAVLAEAEAARDAAVNEALKKGQTLQTGNTEDAVQADITITAKATAEATVEYKTKFETTIDLKGLVVWYDGYDGNDATVDYFEKTDVKGAIQGYVNAITDYLIATYDKADSSDSVVSANLSNISITRKTNGDTGANKFTVNSGSISFVYYTKDTTIATGTSDREATVTSNKVSLSGNQKNKARDNALKNATASEIANKVFTDFFATTELTNVMGQKHTATFDTTKMKVTTKATVVDKNQGDLGREDIAESDIKKTNVSYAYSVSNITYDYQYDKKETETVETKEWNISKLNNVATVYRDVPILNDNYTNYLQGKETTGAVIDLRNNNNEYRKQLDADVAEYNNLLAKYDAAAKKSAAALTAVEKAQGTVNSLKTAIDNLENNFKGKVDPMLANLKKQLDAATKKLEEAEENLGKANEAYSAAETAYNAAVARLTPAPEGPGGDYIPERTIAAAAVADAATPAGPIASIPAADAGVAGARTSRRSKGAALGEAEATNTAEDAGNALEVKKADEKTTVVEEAVKPVKTILDNEIPLAAMPTEKDTNMNWWWLLVIAALGATGEELYRRNKNKKNALAAEIKAEADKADK